jgi:2-dehydro-3-deoxyphosphogalactonate aldolase
MGLKDWLERCPLIAILRGVGPEEVEGIGAALGEAGIAIVEVPFNSPHPLASIERLARAFGDRMLVGAGTLMRPEQASDVAAAGGKLVVTPHANPAIVRAAKQADLFTAPGFFTPAEAFALLEAGTDALKLFPAEGASPAMLKSLRAVLPPGTMVLPVGGIDAGNMKPWLDAGAAGFGIGSSIYKPGDDARTVSEKARRLVAGLKGASGPAT